MIGQKEDVFQYAQCLLLCGHYQRAVHQLKLTELDKVILFLLHFLYLHLAK